MNRSCVTPITIGVCMLLGPGPAQSKDIREPRAILKAIEEIVGPEMQEWCNQQGISYPPDAVVLRIFKADKEIEIWAKNAPQPKMALVKTVPICAMDFDVGPKLYEGDGKTPEGFYHPEFSYQSTKWWMWMVLDKEEIDEQGKVGTGSSFKMCLDYPNALDRRRSSDAGHSQSGSGICLHGNCVSIGCASFQNRDFLPVFAFARRHDQKKYGKVQVHIFPFRFDKVTDIDARTLEFKQIKKFDKAALKSFWENLRKGHEKFNADPNPLKFSVTATSYKFD